MSDSPTHDGAHRLIASDRVEGTAVYDRNGEKVGSVRNFMVDKQSGQAEYAVLQFGGILGIGNEYYPIPWGMLNYSTEKHGYLVDITKEQVESAPRFISEAPPFDHHYGRSVFDYYGMAYPYL